MRGQVRGRSGCATCGEVSRAREEAVTRGGDPKRDERGVLEGPGTQRDVEPLGDEVDATIRQVDRDLDVRIGLEELRKQRSQERLSDRHRRCHPQASAGLTLLIRDRLLRGFEAREGSLRLLDERGPRIGQRKASGRAAQELGAEVLLELGDLAAHARLRHPELRCRRAEAACLYHAYEDESSVEVQVSHGRDSLSANRMIVPVGTRPHTLVMESTEDGIAVGTPAKAGAALLALWGVLHVWVGFEGARRYLGGVHGQWEMLLGGSHAPRAAFQHTTDALTANVQAHLLLNFCIDVGGYGLLGKALAWRIYTRRSWAAYLIAAFVIGVADNAFLFTQVTPGFIELNAGTIGGPVLWAAMCIVTPFGLRSARRAARLGVPVGVS